MRKFRCYEWCIAIVGQLQATRDGAIFRLVYGNRLKKETRLIVSVLEDLLAAGYADAVYVLSDNWLRGKPPHTSRSDAAMAIQESLGSQDGHHRCSYCGWAIRESETHKYCEGRLEELEGYDDSPTDL